MTCRLTTCAALFVSVMVCIVDSASIKVREQLVSTVSVGHHPDLQTCHSNCEAAKACGEKGICMCHCCSDGTNNDGCFCYTCAPLGLPVTPFSQHENGVLEEPKECKGSKQMCGGMFGSTLRVSKAETERVEAKEKLQKLALSQKSLEKNIAENTKKSFDIEKVKPKPVSELSDTEDIRKEKLLDQNVNKLEGLKSQTSDNDALLQRVKATEDKLRKELAVAHEKLMKTRADNQDLLNRIDVTKNKKLLTKLKNIADQAFKGRTAN